VTRAEAPVASGGEHLAPRPRGMLGVVVPDVGQTGLGGPGRMLADYHRTRGGAGSPWPSCHEITGLRSTPIFSISASITSPGLR
jgi:hypothetical protein